MRRKCSLLAPILALALWWLGGTVYAETGTVPAASEDNTAVELRYTVRSGDTLWAIAQAYQIPIDVIIKANRLKRPDRLHAGQVLNIPGVSATLAKSTSPARPAKPQPSLQVGTETPIAGAALAELINQRRAQEGLKPLKWSGTLAQVAQAHAEDCARRKSCSHSGSDGSTYRQRLARLGFSPRWASENWAYAKGPKRAIRWWWNEPEGSDPHRRNILNERYTKIGIGVARGQWGLTYFVADFSSKR